MASNLPVLAQGGKLPAKTPAGTTAPKVINPVPNAGVKNVPNVVVKPQVPVVSAVGKRSAFLAVAKRALPMMLGLVRRHPIMTGVLLIPGVAGVLETVIMYVAELVYDYVVLPLKDSICDPPVVCPTATVSTPAATLPIIPAVPVPVKGAKTADDVWLRGVLLSGFSTRLTSDEVAMLQSAINQDNGSISTVLGAISNIRSGQKTSSIGSSINTISGGV